ncbi:hypothetical protein FDG2_5438 [Candidatus Protofrankia californiensis]|uniref:Uncharacterized protein n=1 Tax=Candidatus Protofrankia californiensis TaxID=1839754 RepID=A0A1C3PDA3_9ACTN|nr:hypothetical protein FDG2_5438 [Candidatus Protofrankia californiensis]
MASEGGEIIVEVDMWAALPYPATVGPQPPAAVHTGFDRPALGGRFPQRPTLPLAREFGHHARPGLRSGEDTQAGLRSGEDTQAGLRSGEDTRPRSGEDSRSGLRSAPPLWSNRPRPIDRSG